MNPNENFSISDLKIAILYGKRPVDNINKDGQLEKIYKYDEDTYHYFYMKNYLKDNMKSEKELQLLTNTPHTNSNNSLAFEVQNLGHIVFLENTSNPQYKSGIFFMPSNISDKQAQTLKIFADKLLQENYNIIELSNLYRETGGVLNGVQRMGKADILNDLIYRSSDER